MLKDRNINWANTYQKKAGVSILTSEISDFRTKEIFRNKLKHCIMINQYCKKRHPNIKIYASNIS